MNDPVWTKQYGTVPAHLTYERASLYEQFRRAAYKYRNRLAFDCYGERVRYSKLLSLTDALANTLETVGVKAGDSVCLMLPGGVYATALIYAVSRIGAVGVLLPENVTETELSAVLRQENAAAFILSDILYDKFRGLLSGGPMHNIIAHRLWQEAPRSKRTAVKKKILCETGTGPIGEAPLYLDKLAAHNDYACPSAPFDGSVTRQTALRLYGRNENGGLTPLSFTAFALTVAATQFAAGLLEYGEEQGLVMPLPFASMLSLSVTLAALKGGMTHITDPYTGDFCDTIYDACPETVLATPSDWKQWIDLKHGEKETMFFFKNVFFVSDSDETLQNRLYRLLSEHECEAAVRNCYSLNETAGAVITTPLAPHRLNALGVPLSDAYVKVCGPDGQMPLYAGQTGEIVVATPSLMQNETPDVVRDAYGNRWLKTGDIGYMEPDGTVFLTGRKKRICKVGGKTVFLKVTEEALRRTGQIEDVQCEPVEDERYGQRIKAYIQPKTPPEDVREFAGLLLRTLKKQLPAENLPVAFAVVTELYRRADGRVDTERLTAGQKTEQSPFTLL